MSKFKIIRQRPSKLKVTVIVETEPFAEEDKEELRATASFFNEIVAAWGDAEEIKDLGETELNFNLQF